MDIHGGKSHPPQEKSSVLSAGISNEHVENHITKNNHFTAGIIERSNLTPSTTPLPQHTPSPQPHPHQTVSVFSLSSSIVNTTHSKAAPSIGTSTRSPDNASTAASISHLQDRSKEQPGLNLWLSWLEAQSNTNRIPMAQVTPKILLRYLDSVIVPMESSNAEQLSNLALINTNATVSGASSKPSGSLIQTYIRPILKLWQEEQDQDQQHIGLNISETLPITSSSISPLPIEEPMVASLSRDQLQRIAQLEHSHRDIVLIISKLQQQVRRLTQVQTIRQCQLSEADLDHDQASKYPQDQVPVQFISGPTGQIDSKPKPWQQLSNTSTHQSSRRINHRNRSDELIAAIAKALEEHRARPLHASRPYFQESNPIGYNQEDQSHRGDNWDTRYPFMTSPGEVDQHDVCEVNPLVCSNSDALSYPAPSFHETRPQTPSGRTGFQRNDLFVTKLRKQTSLNRKRANSVHEPGNPFKRNINQSRSCSPAIGQANSDMSGDDTQHRVQKTSIASSNKTSTTGDYYRQRCSPQRAQNCHGELHPSQTLCSRPETDSHRDYCEYDQGQHQECPHSKEAIASGSPAYHSSDYRSHYFQSSTRRSHKGKHSRKQSSFSGLRSIPQQLQQHQYQRLSPRVFRGYDQHRVEPHEYSNPLNQQEEDIKPLQQKQTYSHHQQKQQEVPPPIYVMNRQVNTVPELWKEWTVGLGPGDPSIRQLEEQYGPSWRTSSSAANFFSRRLRIINEIQRMINFEGLSEEEAVNWLEARREQGIAVPDTEGMIGTDRQPAQSGGMSLHRLSEILRKKQL